MEPCLITVPLCGLLLMCIMDLTVYPQVGEGGRRRKSGEVEEGRNCVLSPYQMPGTLSLLIIA